MKQLWLIENDASGSASRERSDAVRAFCTAEDRVLLGVTIFPKETLPAPGDLDARNVDTVVVFAGDGTANAAAVKLADWGGELLVLPGGTMNMLSERLHGEKDFDTLLQRAGGRAGEASRVPCVRIGNHCAYVAVIAGPAAAWVHVREAVREGRWRRLRRAVGFAWTLTFSRTVRVSTGAQPQERGRAVNILPPEQPDGELEIEIYRFNGVVGALIAAFAWLSHSMGAQRHRGTSHARNARLTGRGRIHLLVDGEEHHENAPLRAEADCRPLRFRRLTIDEGPSE